ncbi:hypothetical protein O9H85_05490 [Paenibacillus filicis]|uniref:Uncharacterized protein n=1 Tax=Paenibacillus gyeongsangnamensis TaxID=3388067 RepID=A0ABT4Q4T3_9BACL|nr:hypothetical protein [Paenibacillus filicis]MCZ8511883.1 hypothetical protein [Paenibacillus filicis]
MLKKCLILSGLFLLLIIMWIVAGAWLSSEFGSAGLGGSLLIGFVTVPLVLRFAVMKLFHSREGSA